MECSRCCLQPVIYAFTQANLDNSLGRMKTKEIIAAVNNLKSVFQTVCSRCKDIPCATNDLVGDISANWETLIAKLEQSAQKDNLEFDSIIEDLRQAFQAVCHTCAKVSDDDNPSNHGQTFVSLDSGNCQADSGRARYTHTDDNIVQSRADWIGLHRAPEVGGQTFGMSPADNMMLAEDAELQHRLANETSSLLPSEVEDVLRREFGNFVQLDIIDKMLLSCIMSGMNIAEFAKMLWFPYSIVDPKTRMVKAITKQAAHSRWLNICKRFPIFMSVAISNSKKSQKSLAKLKQFVMDPNGDEPEDKFQNGKVTSIYARAAKKLQDEKAKAQRIKEEKEREKLLALARAQLQKQQKAQRINKKQYQKQVEKHCDFLPGFAF